MCKNTSAAAGFFQICWSCFQVEASTHFLCENNYISTRGWNVWGVLVCIVLLSHWSVTLTCRSLHDWAGGVRQGALVSRWRGRGPLLQGQVSPSWSPASSSTDLRSEGEGCGGCSAGAWGKNKSVIWCNAKNTSHCICPRRVQSSSAGLGCNGCLDNDPTEVTCDLPGTPH